VGDNMEVMQIFLPGHLYAQKGDPNGGTVLYERTIEQITAIIGHFEEFSDTSSVITVFLSFSDMSVFIDYFGSFSVISVTSGHFRLFPYLSLILQLLGVLSLFLVHFRLFST
jgi:hypothetical protein